MRGFLWWLVLALEWVVDDGAKYGIGGEKLSRILELWPNKRAALRSLRKPLRSPVFRGMLCGKKN